MTSIFFIFVPASNSGTSRKRQICSPRPSPASSPLSFQLFSFNIPIDSTPLFPVPTTPKILKCQLPLMICPCHEPDMQKTMECKLWTRAELTTIIKDFLKPRQNQQLFIKEFRILLSTYDPGFPDLYQFYICCSEPQMLNPR